MPDPRTYEQSAPVSIRRHIGIFGRRNSGKSSLINRLAGQDVAIVSEQAGTTTDPVRKTMEIPGIGPLVIIDTAGIDDDGKLGRLRVERSTDVIRQVDLAIIVWDSGAFGDMERRLIRDLDELNTPFFIVHSKSDLEELDDKARAAIEKETGTECISFSSTDGRNLEKLIDLIKKYLPGSPHENPSIAGDLVRPGDTVLMITPVDIETPAGRLILPQVQTIRDLLDHNCIAIVMKETELERFMQREMIRPRLVITDSQAFDLVGEIIPGDIPLTSFSILFSRLKGDFDAYLEGTPFIHRLRDDDRILIMESCSHHVAGDDIGRVKIPRWIKQVTGKDLHFDITAGLDKPPSPIESYSMVIQCGGCMLTRTQVMNRLKPAIDAGIPVSNYGMTIAWCLGIFERAVEPLINGSREARSIKQDRN